MKHKAMLLLGILLVVSSCRAQTAWPSESWNAAANLTGVMDANGLLELSGLHWNPVSGRLFVAHGDGRVRILQWSGASNAFTAIANISGIGGPEGITQVSYNANEFYTVDEDDFEVRRYTLSPDLTTATLTRYWDLLASPSPMTNTGNTGPEGIAFIPDSILAARGFISQLSGAQYTSTKGMGGLLFVAHQDGGYIWVFDVNPAVNNNFAYVGRYKTNRSESCDLEFDSSTGLLYILHNTGGNTVEVTDLTSAPVSGGRKFVTVKEYTVPNPSGNTNIEGFALTPRSGPLMMSTGTSAFFCRDVESDEPSAERKDCLRWFQPFSESGPAGLRGESADGMPEEERSLYPNPATTGFSVRGRLPDAGNTTVTVFNVLGQRMLEQPYGRNSTVDIARLTAGVYFVEIAGMDTRGPLKLIKR